MIDRRFLLLGCAALAGCGPMLAPGDAARFEAAGTDLLVSGTITGRTPQAFRDAMVGNPQVTRLVLTQMNGSVDDEAMIDMAYEVRARGLNTHLRADSEIYSGAVDFYLAGVQRTMEAGALIGVHAWSDSFGAATDYAPDAPEHALNLAYVTDMLGAPDFYWFTLRAAPPDGIHLMTAAEIARFGVLTRPMIKR